MPRVRCRYLDCIFLDEGYCTTEAIIIDPDEGCVTYTQLDDVTADKDWEEEELEGFWDEGEDELLADDDDDDDMWLDEEL
ncbi:MAG: hypothetical protein GTO18_11835 [Anaerolineales bacterium]|nr:hypothetical protein [Anaerolineales bacterium]